MKKGTAVKQPTAQQLGRKNAEYGRLRVKGIPDESILKRMEEDAVVMGLTLEDYQGRLADVGRKSGEGKRAALKVKKEVVQAKHLTVASFLNEVKTTGSTDLAELQTALNELGEEAEGWVLMTAVEKDAQTGDVLFTLNDSGWNDGSSRSHQYSDRPQMVGKSGVRTTHPFQIHGS